MILSKGKKMGKTIEGHLNANGLRVAIVASRFNEFVVDALVKGAQDCLVRHGAHEKDIDLVKLKNWLRMVITMRL